MWIESQFMLVIEEAKEYVFSLVQSPALQSALQPEIKSKVRNSNIWLSKFNRVGDLLTYLRRFKGAADDPVYTSMKALGLLTFEDILPEFEKRFAAWENDRTRLADFVIGEDYSSFEVLIFCNNYDTRAGGMFVLASNGIPACVVVKATLNGGMYPNQWIVPGQLLKYYLKSKNGVFNENFSANKAILENHNLPIATFVRDTEGSPFTYFGQFHYHDIVRDPDGAKYFFLQLKAQMSEGAITSDYVQREFRSSVTQSAQSPRQERLARLAKAPKKAAVITVVSKAYRRNPDVVAEVLFRAADRCERCDRGAPFLRKSDGTGYLEVHHKVQLANGGDDTVENALALCPNCHRELHFGSVQLT
jgi:5-methylcytosine-specific restriction protein A